MNEQQIVSDPGEELILVDIDDKPVGTLSKAECHTGDGVLHRAFSIFLFDSKQRVLLQQRSADKPLWPLFWSNSCCSHPRRGESMEVALARRLQEELGVECPLEFLYTFRYRAKYEDIGAEHEVCHVYFGQYDGEVRPNPTEIAATRYLPGAELDAELARSPGQFTPWFKLEWTRIRECTELAAAHRQVG